ncbi:MAG: type II secretion system protein N [Betaproteobacteria bacterium]
MLKKFAAIAVHLVFFALVMAIAAYWGVRIFTPAPTAAPPPIAPPPMRDPDPVAAARMFGKVERIQAATTNIQAIGAYSAGKDSSAVLSVDGRPARVFLLGQEVAPGLRLAAVGAEVVVLESGGARQELRLPPRAVAAFGGAPPPPNFTRQGNTLSAPSAGATTGGRPAGAPTGQLPQPPQPQQPQPQPQLPQPEPPPPAPPPGAPPAQAQ